MKRANENIVGLLAIFPQLGLPGLHTPEGYASFSHCRIAELQLSV